MLQKTLMMVALLLVASCAQTKFNLQANKDSHSPTYDRAQDYFVGGIGQQKNIDPGAICGGRDKVVRVETEYTPANWAVGAITFGIYTPLQARVYCAE